jgi:hypothetical protein
MKLLMILAVLFCAQVSQAAFSNSGQQCQEYVYDFAKDGGAVSTITLSSKAGARLLPSGFVVQSVTMRVLTAFTSGGSATLAWGNTADADGYSGVAVAVASLTANSTFNGYEDGTSPSALLFDNTDDAPAFYPVTSTAGTQNFTIAIATAAMTAGKAVFVVCGLMPRG